MKMNIKNKFISCIILIMLLSTIWQVVPAQNDHIEKEEYQLIKEITIEFSENDLFFENNMGYDIIKISDCSMLSRVGEPMLPIKIIKVAIPNKMNINDINIANIETEILNGDFTIFPAQPAVTTDKKDVDVEFSAPNFDVYSSNEAYPSEIVEFIMQTDLAGQNIAVIQIYPIHYTTSENKITLLTSISFKILGNPGNICSDYLPTTISETNRKTYEKMVKNMVINPEDVNLISYENLKMSNLEPGQYDYVIITKEDWIDDFQPLADWKTKKGVPTKIVDIEWIYSNYTVDLDQDKIRNFIIDSHNTWGSCYFLLGGDVNVILNDIRGYYFCIAGIGCYEFTCPTDTTYSDYDDDFECEVHVGRASVNNSNDITTFINKIITYEKNPPLNNYAMNAAFFGFDLFGTDYGEMVKKYIDSNYVPSNWMMNNVYDSDPGDHKINVINAINSGQNLINHDDHADEYRIGVGSENHDLWLNFDDVDKLNNGFKQSILYSIGCLSTNFPVDDCIAEHFVHNPDGGCIAFIGNTQYGLCGSLETRSARYDCEFFESLFIDNFHNLGVCFSDHKNDYYPTINCEKFIFQELTLLGDPELPIWTEDPQCLLVSHLSDLNVGVETSVNIHVEDSIIGDIENAYVCLWLKDEIYENGFTDSQGNFTLSIESIRNGDLYVTVTKHNYLPYESVIIVNPIPGQPYIPSNPFPENGAAIAEMNITLSWECGDPEDDMLTYDVYFGDISSQTLIASDLTNTYYHDLSPLDSGKEYYWYIVANDNNGSYPTYSPLWNFTTIECSCLGGCGDANGEGNVDIDDIVYLISYIFSGGPAPAPEPCCGDANGSVIDGYHGVDVDDIVYLISYVFSGGPAPHGCCGGICD